jgi:hypothetical protein
MKEATKQYLVKEGILYRAGWIKVPQDEDTEELPQQQIGRAPRKIKNAFASSP